MMCEVFGPIDQSHFIRESSSGDRFLTTARLEEYTNAWWKTLKKLSSSRNERREAILEAHRCVSEVYTKLDQEQWCRTINALLGKRFVLAIQVIGASLTYAVSKFAKTLLKIQGTVGTWSDKWRVLWKPYTSSTNEKMIQAGWCPNEIDRFTSLHKLALSDFVEHRRRNCFMMFARGPPVKRTLSTKGITKHCMLRRAVSANSLKLQ